MKPRLAALRRSTPLQPSGLMLSHREERALRELLRESLSDTEAVCEAAWYGPMTVLWARLTVRADLANDPLGDGA